MKRKNWLNILMACLLVTRLTAGNMPLVGTTTLPGLPRTTDAHSSSGVKWMFPLPESAGMPSLPGYLAGKGESGSLFAPVPSFFTGNDFISAGIPADRRPFYDTFFNAVIDSPPVCRARITASDYGIFMCHNLGAANTGADPFTPGWEINGGYWQWGRMVQAIGGPTGPGSGVANDGPVSGWNGEYAANGSWQDATRTANDPCPAGYRVPSKALWDSVIVHNTLTDVGSWTNNATNYSSGKMFGDELFLPAAGLRSLSDGELLFRGGTGAYWSSMESGTDGACSLNFTEGGAGTIADDRVQGYSVRCVQEAETVGAVAVIMCDSAVTSGTLRAGRMAENVGFDLPYSGGNGGSHAGQTVASTGVGGLTAVLLPGNFNGGVGTLSYSITGTPDGAGRAYFALNIGGQSCILPVWVRGITGAEYFLDVDPGVGNGISVSVPSGDTVSGNFTLNTAGLTPGMHNLYLRGRNESGQWGYVQRQSFFVEETGSNEEPAQEQIVAAEYFIDTDPGVGNGTSLPVASGDTVSGNFTLNTAGLTPGMHNLYLRGRNASGQWGYVHRQSFFVEETGSNEEPAQEQIVAAEYFIDTDPGVGNGTSLPVASGDTVSGNFTLNTAGLTPGMHNLYLRGRNASGQWGYVQRQSFFVEETGSNEEPAQEQIVAAEYFIDTDPGVGNGTSLPVAPGDTVSGNFTLNTAGLTPGMHNLYLRGRNASGQWGYTNRQTFYVNEPQLTADTTILDVVAAEYFIDTDPGVGNGTPFNIMSGDTATGNFMLNTAGLTPGMHNLYVRGRSSAGQWGFINRQNFYVEQPKDTASLTLEDVVAAEYFIDTDPGVGNGTSFQLSNAPGDTVNGQFSLPTIGCLTPGVHWIYTRGRNSAGQWGFYERASITVTGVSLNLTGITHQPASNCGITESEKFRVSVVNAGTNVIPAGAAKINLDVSGANTGTYGPFTNPTDIPAGGTLVITTGEINLLVPGTNTVRASMGLCNQNPLLNSVSVTVNGVSGNIPLLTTPASQAVCNGQQTLPVVFSASIPGTTFTWSNSNPLIGLAAAGSGNIPAFTAVNTGSQPVTAVLTVTPRYDTCVGASRTFNIVINPTPAVAIQSQGCSGNNVTLTSSGWASYMWNTGASTGQITVPNPGTYVLTVTDANGCTGSASTVLVPLTEPVITIAENSGKEDNDGIFCSGSTVTLVSSIGSTYKWSTGGQSSAVTVSQGGTYTVTVSDQWGCSATASAGLSRNQSPVLSFAGGVADDPFYNHAVSPFRGTIADSYTFRVKYTDADNEPPASGSPGMRLNYYSGGATHPYDRNLVLNQSGGNVFTSGVIYEVTIPEGLPLGTGWNTIFSATDTSGCPATVTSGLNVSEPDVMELPDLTIFANDIKFSSFNPQPGAPVTIYTTVNNESDYPASNFRVRMRNEFTNEEYGVQTISLAANASQTLVWNITATSVASWNPIRVIVDDTDLIVESYENNNRAARPLVVGNYPISGRIQATASAGDLVLNSYQCNTLSGYATYQDLPPATNMNGTSVAGSTVIFWREGGTDTIYTTTNSNGWFSYANAFCSPPLSAGTYTISGIVTDYTFVDTFSTTFRVYQPVYYTCEYPDLSTSVSGSTSCIFPGTANTYTVRVTNHGSAAAPATVARITPSSNLQPSVPHTVNVPALASGQYFETTITYTMPASPQTVWITATADVNNELPGDCYYPNNTGTIGIPVVSTLPDLLMWSQPGYVTYPNICQNNSFDVLVRNVNCNASGNAVLRTVVTRIADDAVWTVQNNIPALEQHQMVQISFPDLFPDVFQLPGQYRIDHYIDYLGQVGESNESNNHSTHYFEVQNCFINLYPSCGIQSTSLKYYDGAEPSYDIPVRVYNGGLAPLTDNFDVTVQVMNGNNMVQTISYTESTDIAPGAYAERIVNIAGLNPCAAEYDLRISVDTDNEVSEGNEQDNICGGSRLFRDYAPGEDCYYYGDFWDRVYPTGQPYNVYSWVRKRGDFKDSALKVRLEMRPQGTTNWLFNEVVTIQGPLVAEGTDGCPQFRAISASSYTFGQTGVWEIRVTTDPDNELCETLETNNQLLRTFLVRDEPDFVALSQWIDPEELNPDPGQIIDVNVSYRNRGQTLVTSQPFLVKLKLDDMIVATIAQAPGVYAYDELRTITFQDIQMPDSYTDGNLAEAHILRVIVDSENWVYEYDELNNEATRAVIIGGAPDAQIFSLAYTGGNISALIKNTGSSPVLSGTLRFYYRDIYGAEYEITGGQGIAIGSIPVNGQATRTFAWNAPEAAELLIGRISSVAPIEINDLNNEKSRLLDNQTCPDLSASAPPASITNSVCSTGCVPADGFIGAPATDCPTGASVQYAVSTDGGLTYSDWSAALPVYNQEGPVQQIKTRCQCEADGTVVSTESAAVSTSPGTCVDNLQPEIIITENSGLTSDDALVCPGAEVTLTVGGGAFVQQQWGSGSTAPVVVVYPQSDTYYSVVVTDQNGCTASKTALVSVRVINAFISGYASVCPGSTAVLTAGGGSTYEWNTGDLNPAITVSPSQTTIYTVTVSDAGCSVTATKQVSSGSDILPEAYCRSSVTVELDSAGLAVITGEDIDFGSFDYLMSCPYSAQFWDTIVPGNAVAEIMAPDIILQSPDDLGQSFGASARACIQNPEQAVIVLDWGYSTTDVLPLYDPFGYSIDGVFVQLTEDLGTVNQYGSTNVQVNAGQLFCLEQRTLDSYTGSARTITTLKRGVTLSLSRTTFNCQNLGNNTVTLTVTDENYNTGQCQSIVNVTDSQAPVLTNCPSDIVVGNDIDKCSASVNYTTPLVTDNCQYQLNQTQGLPSGSVFPVGVTTVVYELVENNTVRAECSFQVTVTDSQWPSAQCRDIVVSVSGGSAAVYPVDISNGSSDNCSGTLQLSLGMPGPKVFSCADAGEHLLTLTVTDDAGNTSQCTSRVTVNPGTPVAAISVNQSAPCGGPVTLTASGGQAYHWSTGETVPAITVQPAATTVYVVTVTSASGCTDTAEMQVSPSDSFIAGIDGVGAICRSTSGTLTAYGGGTYKWSTGATTESITVAPVFSTTYTVTVTGNNGCSAIFTKVLTVHALPAPDITGSMVICAGQVATLTASGGTGYLWNNQSTDATIQVAPQVTTTYSVTVTDQNGCSARKTREVLVNPVPNIQIVGPSSVCAGTLAVLSVTGAGNGPVFWSTGASGTPVELLPQISTDYTVTVTSSAGCSATAMHTVGIAAPLQAAITSSGVLCSGGNIELTATGGDAYSWNNGSAASTIGVSSSGTYVVTVSSTGGCTNTAVYMVETLNAPSINSISPAFGSPGTPIVITGNYFTPGSSVWINGIPASGASYVSSTQMQAMFFDEGQIQFASVSNECGAGLLELSNTPQIISFTPESGAAGSVVDVTGTGLGTLSSLMIGNNQALILHSTPNFVRAYVMPGATTGPVVAFTSYGNVSSSGLFTVTPTPFPYVQEGEKLTGTGAPGSARQGMSVAVSSNGNTALVGGPSDDGGKGAAWIYTRENGVWTQRVRLTPPDAIGKSAHGISVALSADGRTAVVGGSGDNLNKGAVWVYTPAGEISGNNAGTDDSWFSLAPVVKLTGTGGLGSAVQLGATVAVSADGRKIVAGAPGDNTGVGAVWTFRKVNGVWQQTGQKLTGANYVGRSRQGSALALSPNGTMLLVGGTHDNQRKGATWVFQDYGSGWSQTGDKLVGTDGSADNYQGSALAISADGNTAMIGGCNDNTLRGAVWVFSRGWWGGWYQQGAKLVGSGLSGASRFGGAVSLSADGKTAVIGGHGDGGGHGALWTYQLTDGQWQQQGNKITGTGASGRAIRQGISVAVSATGGTALLGGSGDAANRGAAWVFIPGAAARERAEQAGSEQLCTKEGMTLLQNIPNPLSDRTTIGFSIPEACEGEWIISDVEGRVVVTLRRDYPAGENTETFDMGLYSGVYWYTLKTPFGALTRRMVVTR